MLDFNRRIAVVEFPSGTVKQARFYWRGQSLKPYQMLFLLQFHRSYKPNENTIDMVMVMVVMIITIIIIIIITITITVIIIITIVIIIIITWWEGISKHACWFPLREVVALITS